MKSATLVSFEPSSELKSELADTEPPLFAPLSQLLADCRKHLAGQTVYPYLAKSQLHTSSPLMALLQTRS